MPARSAKRALIAILTLVVIAVGGNFATATTATAVGAGDAQPTTVSSVPSRATPNITDGVVYAITKVGSEVIVGGSFTTVQSRGSSTSISQPYLLAFDAATGDVSTTFTPVLDGKVEALLPGPTANTVYVGGFFKNVNGVKSKSLTLLDTTTGQIVSGFKPPALNGAVWSLAAAPNELLATGTFTTAGAATRGGLLSVNPTTGALDSFLSVQLAGHHNYNGISGAQAAVGGRAMAVNPAGTRLVLLGNFKTADGLPRDQMAIIDLDGPTAAVDPNWATLEYTATCASQAFDTYVSDVQWAPDGSYFVTDATGGATTSLNSDGSRSLCDSVERWNAGDIGANVQPAWVDYTGNDTLWSVAVSGSTVYVGGHERWLNNYSGRDSAGQGAVPRPGVAALDPVSGMPLSWNPGRNPRGKGAYALYLSDDGLYVGSDTDWFGNFEYKRQKIGFFPLAGGTAPAPTSVATLPANVYLGGPSTGGRRTSYTDALEYRPMSQTQVGATTTLTSTGPAWSSVRGAFVVGNTLFYGTTQNQFFEAPFDGSTVGAPSAVDPYHDPAWCSVQTGSGQTYCGVSPGYYSQLSTVTGAFYQNGRLYYTMQNQPNLYWRWFSPDSGTVGSQQFSVPASPLSSAAGMFASGNTLYYANRNDGTLHAMDFTGGVPNPATDAVVDNTQDWRATNLFLYGSASF